MTRMEKWEDKRNQIKEEIRHTHIPFPLWLELKYNQKEIKKEKGCKH